MIIKDTDILARLEALTQEVNELRDQLHKGVGVPDYRAFSNGDVLTIVSNYPAWGTPSAYVSSIGVTAPITSTGGLTPTLGHATSGAAANTYNLPSQIIINAEGHVTSATDGAAAINGAFNAKANLAGGNAFSGAQTFSTTISVSGTATINALALPGTSGQYVTGTGARATFPTIPSGTVTAVNSGNGMNFSSFSGSGTVVLGTPSTCTNATSNATTTNSHTHSVTGFLPLGGGTLTGGLSGTTATFSGNITQTSDAKFKSDITDMRDGIDIIRACLPRRYFNKITGKMDVGFVAQELDRCFPESVHESEDGLSVDYARMVVPLAAALLNIDARLKVIEDRNQ